MRKLAFVIVALLLMGMLPAAAFAQGGFNVTYTSGFNLQNLGGATATVLIEFYNANGTVVASINDTIPAGTNKTYYPMQGVPTGFTGSAVISSDQQLAAITNVLGNVSSSGAQRGDAYPGFTAGGAPVYLPLVMKNNFGINTWFNVQNTGTAPATVTVRYSPGTCTDSFTIPVNAAHTFDQTTTACLGSSFIGAATIESNQPVAAVVMQVNSSSLLAYGGFTGTGSQQLVMPSVQSNYYKSGTSLNIQNTGAVDTSVEVTYTPSAGFPGASCKETKVVPHGQSVIFGFPQLPAACGTAGTGVTDPVNKGFVGSAAVTGNSAGQNLVGIVNQITRGAANGSAYDAFDPNAGKAHVSMPLIMDRNFGIFTGFSIVNVGAQATNVNCTFSGGVAYTVSATLQPGQSTTAAQLNQIQNGYLGAGTCTATGGDTKIVGIVNERVNGAPATVDSVYSYNAFSY